MRLAFLLYRYVPHGGHAAGLAARWWKSSGNAAITVAFTVSHGRAQRSTAWMCAACPQLALRSHRRNQRFHAWVRADLERDPVDGVVGFNKMPGLDIYYAADSCYLDTTLRERGRLYRRSAHFRHCADWERAVFGRGQRYTDFTAVRRATGRV